MNRFYDLGRVKNVTIHHILPTGRCSYCGRGWHVRYQGLRD
jgi:hypothetical protein